MAFKKYAVDVKLLVVRWARRCIPLEDINERLGCGISQRSVGRWLKLYNRTRSVINEPALYEKRGTPGLLTAEEKDFIEQIITEDPTLYVDEARERLYRETGKWLSTDTVARVLHEQLQLTLKTARTVHPMQNDASRGRFLLAMADIRPECLVFVDESGVSVDEVRRTMAWAPIGQRTARLVKRTCGTRYNMIHGIALSGTVGTLVKEGAVTRKHFCWYLKERLLPFMNAFPGVNSVLVLDNASIHKGPVVQRLAAEAGVRVMYLPAYSPDFNPIEKGFSVFKAYLRRHKSLNCEDVVNAIYSVTESLFTRELCHKLFEGSGFI